MWFQIPFGRLDASAPPGRSTDRLRKFAPTIWSRPPAKLSIARQRARQRIHPFVSDSRSHDNTSKHPVEHHP